MVWGGAAVVGAVLRIDGSGVSAGLTKSGVAAPTMFSIIVGSFGLGGSPAICSVTSGATMVGSVPRVAVSGNTQAERSARLPTLAFYRPFTVWMVSRRLSLLELYDCGWRNPVDFPFST
jgi:hypothetical protein